MRSILSFLLLAACSDYDLVAQGKEPADASLTETVGEEPEVDTGDDEIPTDTSTETDTAVVPVEDTGEDTELEPSEECPGYVIFSGFWNYDEDGHGTPEYVEVESLMLFTLIGDTEIEVAAGEDVTFNVAATALTCGPTQLHTLFNVVEDYEGNAWLVELNNDRVESGYLTEMSSGEEFPAITPENMDVTPTGDELFYEWCAEDLGDARCTDIATREFDAGSTDVYTFTFSPGEYAPAGTTYEIHLSEAIWTDGTSGETIRDTLWSDVYITVTVV